MSREQDRRLAAILAADVAGYSRLMGADESGTLAVIEELQERILLPTAEGFSGRLFKSMGDGFLFEFSSVVAAMRFAVKVQHELQKWNETRPAASPVELRMGLNIGDVIARGEDLFGDAVNVAARLEGIAAPGGVCISEAAMQQLGDRIALDVEDLGERALKNIETPVRAYAVRSASAPRPVVASADKTLESEQADPGFRSYDFASERPSLAIFPFRNIATTSDSEFIAQGISLGLQTLLVQLPNMFFVNACGHAGYRDGSATAAQALAHMPVRYAVEGSVQQVASQLRVNVQVTDLKENTVKWASNYDRSVDNLFALQDEIARSIAGALSVELIGGHMARDFTGGLDGSKSWEHFLRGINYFYRMTKSDHAQAIPHFDALAQTHPNSAIGPCYLAVLYFYAQRRGWSHDPDATLSEAAKWARRALALEEGNNGLGHAVLGAIALEEHKHQEAERLSHIAVGYRASCPFAHCQLGITQTYIGEPENGIRNIRNAIGLRLAGPMPMELGALAVAYRDNGDFDLSIAAAEEAIRIAPEYLDAYVTMTSDFALRGDIEKARKTSEAILSSEPNFRISDFVERQPYLSAEMGNRITTALQTAGLPG
ncbi:adenylate/guanylate cyclase domain-containing protein [Lutimaribacter marinistellae]|uniref:Adenylate/guanylate cyclase domain-containing protein n=1 Tax=Lutimaribacter marinistellae TaxID=1820329 RepID=A0ABV7THD1_9RHOB